ncbi:MAG: diguanylate cyclase [Alphaproteobacteria bacterium]|nr:diguanylate cyclase [Alphaproteobacteria bacterium]
MDIPTEKRSRGPRFDTNVVRMLEISGDLAALCRYGRILEVNSAGCQMLGAETEAELVGTAIVDLVGGDYVPLVSDLILINVISPTSTHVQMQRLDGSPFEASIVICPARELGNGYAMVTVRDRSHEGHLAKEARESESRFRLLVENSMHLICECRGDRIVYMNQAGLTMLGVTTNKNRGSWPIWEIFHPQYREIFASEMDTLLDERAIMPVLLRRENGAIIDAQICVTPLSCSGMAQSTSVVNFMMEARDITAHNRAVSALRKNNETLEQKVIARTQDLAREKLFVEGLLDSVPNPLWWKGLDRTFLGYNRAFRKWHGLDGDEWIGRRMEDVMGEAYIGPAVDDASHDPTNPHVEYEAMMPMAEVGPRHVVVSKKAWSDTNHTPAGVIGVMLDITERKHMEAELRRLATTDGLTGTFNRRHFMVLAEEEYSRAARYGRPLAFLMLDIDHFKRINDTYGHPVGDEAIKALARVCMTMIRPHDSLGRLGGEEFAILLPESSRDGALILAERLRLAVAEIRVHAAPTAAEATISFTASIGAAVLEPDDFSAAAILSRADQALYLAKNGGRNRVVALP